MLAFRAAEAARNQGEEFFRSFHIALLKARHEQRRDIADMHALIEVAGSVNLDVARFENDIRDRRLLAKLIDDHTFAMPSERKNGRWIHHPKAFRARENAFPTLKEMKALTGKLLRRI